MRAAEEAIEVSERQELHCKEGYLMLHWPEKGGPCHTVHADDERRATHIAHYQVPIEGDVRRQ
jgi:hypothetical protein